MIKVIESVKNEGIRKFEIELEGNYRGLNYYVKSFEHIDEQGYLQDFWVNGYVRLPKNHKFHGRSYIRDLEELLSTSNIELSYSEVDPQTESTDWSIGFIANTLDIESVKYDCQDLISSIELL